MAFSLAFSQAPPDHPFVGEYFPVQLTLIDADHEIHGGIELPLSLELYYEEKDKQVAKGVFEVEGSKSPKITKNGMCTCKLHITKSSMELDNRRFVLKASAKMKNCSKLEVWSEPLRVMRYRLVIEEGGILEHDEAETRKMKDAAAVRDSASFSCRRRASSPGEEVVGGFFFDFEPFRTVTTTNSFARSRRWARVGLGLGLGESRVIEFFSRPPGAGRRLRFRQSCMKTGLELI